MASGSVGLASSVASDFRRAGLSPRQLAVATYAERLTREPWTVNAECREALTAAGLDPLERALLTLGCALFNYFNRVADGLGIAADYVAHLSRAPELARELPRAEGQRAALPGHVETGSHDDPITRARHLAPALERIPAILELWSSLRSHVLRSFTGGAEIAAAVAGWNGCRASHRGFLAVEEVLPDDHRREVFLAHARRLSFEPWAVTPGDIDALRATGLDDLGVLRLTILVAYAHFETRALQGLGAR